MGFLGKNGTAPGRRRPCALMLAAALLCALALALAPAQPAVAAPVEVDGSFVHGDIPDDADDALKELDGKTWEEVKEERYHDESAAAEDWDTRPLGGMKYPGFDVFNPFASLKHFLYTLAEDAVGAMVGVCNELFGFIGQTDSLTLEMDDAAFASVYSASVSISERVIQPVAVGFLGLALVLALLQFSREVATSRGDHFAMAGSYIWIIVKFAAIMVLIGHTTLVTRGVYELFLAITRQLVSLLSAIGISQGSFDSLMISLQEISYADFGHVVVLVVVAAVMVVAVAVTVVKVIVLTVTRMFEIYVLAAFSGIPLTMLTTRETREGGLRYFKLFAGACLQAGVLVVMIAFSGVIMSSIALLLELPGGVDAGFVGVIVNLIAPIAGVFGVNAVIGMSREISNRILGA